MLRSRFEQYNGAMRKGVGIGQYSYEFLYIALQDKVELDKRRRNYDARQSTATLYKWEGFHSYPVGGARSAAEPDKHDKRSQPPEKTLLQIVPECERALR